MYELSIQREFCAAHAITIAGVREPVHGHNWRLTVTVRGERLDADGLLCDFHELERMVEAVIGPFDNCDLNSAPPFDEINPTAEHVARHVAEALAARLPSGVSVAAVAITEAPFGGAVVHHDD